MLHECGKRGVKTTGAAYRMLMGGAHPGCRSTPGRNAVQTVSGQPGMEGERLGNPIIKQL